MYSQCILFFKPNAEVEGCSKGYGTLSGNKADVYKMLKIMKLCCDADIESYKMKYAVDRCLSRAFYEEENIGTSLLKVLKYWTLKGKFTGVHPELEKIGIEEIMVSSDNLIFKKSKETRTRSSTVLRGKTE